VSSKYWLQLGGGPVSDNPNATLKGADNLTIEQIGSEDYFRFAQDFGEQGVTS
jgi:hypothetical protein